MEGGLHPMNISVVVPAFNSRESLPHLVERLKPVLDAISQAYELVLVNDGSRDGTWQVISELAGKNNWVRGLNLMRNYGQHNALLAGIRAARHEVIVTMDDDLQHPPEQIPLLLEKLREGFDVVYGTPEKMRHDLFRNLASKTTKWVMKTALGAITAPDISAFRAFHTRTREAFDRFEGPRVSIDVLLTWGAARFAAVDVKHESRAYGKSNYNLRRLVSHTLNMVTGFSVLPLRVASFIGFFFTLFGLGVLFFVLFRYLFLGNSVPGFPFLASIISIFSGVQLFALGLIGEYMARLYLRTMNRPAYMVLETTA
jgi:undecaprenyl-phosphate 4-deoxy-4-formamido-L-arabinose transferase